MLWSVGGGGIAGYRLTADPLAPELVTSSGPSGTNIDFDEATSPYNDFIMHNSQRSGNTLLVTEEDYIDMNGGDQTAHRLQRPGQVRDVDDRRRASGACVRSTPGAPSSTRPTRRRR